MSTTTKTYTIPVKVTDHGPKALFLRMSIGDGEYEGVKFEISSDMRTGALILRIKDEASYVLEIGEFCKAVMKQHNTQDKEAA